MDIRVTSTQKHQKTLKFRVLDWCQVPLNTIMRVHYDLLPQELFNLQAPQHRPHPHNSRPIPFSGPQLIRPTSMTLFWETPLGCPISRSGDIELYLICLLPTAKHNFSLQLKSPENPISHFLTRGA